MTRLSVWLSKEYEWINDALEQIVQAGEAEGMKISKSDLVTTLLSEGLKDYVPIEMPVVRPAISTKTNLRRSVVCSKKDSWLFEAIDKIIGTKKMAGMQSSFNFELLRIAKNGLVRNMLGAEEDRTILKGE